MLCQLSYCPTDQWLPVVDVTDQGPQTHDGRVYGVRGAEVDSDETKPDIGGARRRPAIPAGPARRGAGTIAA